MRLKLDLWNALIHKKFLRGYLERSKWRSPWWCQGARLYDVLDNYINALNYGFLDSRASAIAFQFFKAIFPFILALATLIPYLPIDEQVVLKVISDVFSMQTSDLIYSTLQDFLQKPRIGLISFSFVYLLISVSKSISTMMRSLNNTYQPLMDRPWWVMRLISLVFAFALFFLIVLLVLLLSYQQLFMRSFIIEMTPFKILVFWFLNVLRWILLLVVSIAIISFIYYYAPGGEKKVFKLISPGAFVAVLIIGVSVFLFKIYLNNFSSYNYLYGSLGAVIIFMVLLKTAALSLIIGFELNAAIGLARHKKITN